MDWNMKYSKIIVVMMMMMMTMMNNKWIKNKSDIMNGQQRTEGTVSVFIYLNVESILKAGEILRS